MKTKKERTTFDKVRLTLRWIGITCGATPVLAYMTFAIAFARIQEIRDYENSTVTLVKDLAYQITQTALPIANFGWTYLLPIFFPIAIFDIIVGVRRQMSNGERKMY
jgi:hypothetical protein